MADWSKLTKYMPTGVFLTFQSLVTLTTPKPGTDGQIQPCSPGEVTATAVLLALSALVSFFMAFTDSYTDPVTKTTYYGVITKTGLYSPTLAQQSRLGPAGAGAAKPGGDDPEAARRQLSLRVSQVSNQSFRAGVNDAVSALCGCLTAPNAPAAGAEKGGALGSDVYKFHWSDLAHALLTVAVFLALAMLTQPVVSCFFPRNLDPVIPRAVPTLVTTFAGLLFTFFAPPRASVGHAGTRGDPSSGALAGAPGASGQQHSGAATPTANGAATHPLPETSPLLHPDGVHMQPTGSHAEAPAATQQGGPQSLPSSTDTGVTWASAHSY